MKNLSAEGGRPLIRLSTLHFWEICGIYTQGRLRYCRLTLRGLSLNAVCDLSRRATALKQQEVLIICNQANARIYFKAGRFRLKERRKAEERGEVMDEEHWYRTGTVHISVQVVKYWQYLFQASHKMLAFICRRSQLVKKQHYIKKTKKNQNKKTSVWWNEPCFQSASTHFYVFLRHLLNWNGSSLCFSFFWSSIFLVITFYHSGVSRFRFWHLKCCHYFLQSCKNICNCSNKGRITLFILVLLPEPH